jgi:hypothetical protein
MAPITRHPAMQLQVSSIDVRHWEKLIDFIQKNCDPKKPYCLTVVSKCNLMQGELVEEYMGLYALGEMLNDPLHGQISYHSSLSKSCKLKLEHNVKLVLGEMMAATGKDIPEQVITPAKLIPASLVMVSYAPRLISILRLHRYPMKMKEGWMRLQQVGMRLTVVLM